MKVLGVASAVLFAGLVLPAQATELIANGGFETGTFLGWATADQPGSFGTWFVSSSTTSPASGFPTPGPAGGSFYALTDQTGPGAHVLLQTFTIPVGVTSATLTFEFFSDNQNGTSFCPGPLDFSVSPNQCDRVDILTAAAGAFDTGAGVVANLYEAAPAPNTPPSWTLETFNLTGLGAGTFQLRFGEVDNQFFNQMGVDNVSIDATVAGAIPEPASLSLLGGALLGLGALRRRMRRKRQDSAEG
jgi:hypothetical protein